jgi:hypothetical protein
MCKDLGALWPGCVVVKLKSSSMINCDTQGGAAAYAPTASNVYQGAIRCYPYGALAQIGNGFLDVVGMANDSPANLLGDTVLPVGWAKMISSAGGSGLYLRCCVLRMQYRVKLHHVVVLTGQAVAAGPSPCTGVFAYTRPYDNTETYLTPPSTLSIMTSNLCQPNVRRRYASGTQTQMAGNSAGTAPTWGAGAIARYPVVKFSGSVWPHRTLDMSWATYVSSDSSFSTSANVPTDVTYLEIASHIHKASQAANASTAGMGLVAYHWMEVDLVWTLLFKDPVANAM